MKTTNNVQNGKGNTQNAPDKASIPKGNENDTGVKNGVGIPKVPGKNSSSGKSETKSRAFSNERHIF